MSTVTICIGYHRIPYLPVLSACHAFEEWESSLGTLVTCPVCTGLSCSLSSQASSTVPAHNTLIVLLQGDFPTRYCAIFCARCPAAPKAVLADGE